MTLRYWLAAAFTVTALAACAPETPSTKPNNLVGVAASASASPSPSLSPSLFPSLFPSLSPTAIVPTTAPPIPTLVVTVPAGHPIGAVHPGAFCSPEGAIGYTSAGTKMRCTLKPGEKQPRWRAA